jgi:hypothetical protein
LPKKEKQMSSSQHVTKCITLVRRHVSPPFIGPLIRFPAEPVLRVTFFEEHLAFLYS